MMVRPLSRPPPGPMTAPTASPTRLSPQELVASAKNRSTAERLLQMTADDDANAIGQLPEGFRAHVGPDVHSWDVQLLDEVGAWYVAAATRAGVAEIARCLMGLDAVSNNNERLIAALGIRKDALGRWRLPRKLNNGEEQSRILMRTIAEHAFNVLILPDDAQRNAASVR